MFGVFNRIFTEIDSYGTLMWRSDVFFLILTDQTVAIVIFMGR